jgi:hypothetical protein
MMGLSKLFRHGDRVDEYVRTADERALVRRLDTFLLTFGCLSQGTHIDLQSPCNRKTNRF